MPESEPALATQIAYCVKCRKKTTIKDPRQVQYKNGSHAWRGTCPTCGIGVSRMLSGPPAVE